jgi:hypothetical protein
MQLFKGIIRFLKRFNKFPHQRFLRCFPKIEYIQPLFKTTHYEKNSSISSFLAGNI